jgi:hypothetical protein
MQNSNQRASLQGKFQDFGAMPSDALWGSITEVLDEKKKRRGIIWWWIAGSSAAVLITLFAVVNSQINNSSETNSHIIVEEENEEEFNSNVNNKITEISATNKNEVMDLEENVEFIDSENQNESNNVLIETMNQNYVSELVESINEQSVKNNNDELEDHVRDRFSIEPMRPSITELLSFIPINPKIPEIEIVAKTDVSKPWEFGFELAYWNDIGTKEQTQTSSLELFDNTSNVTTVDQSGVGVNSIYNAPEPTLNNGWVRKNVNINLFAGKYISERWAWRTGLEYARTSYYSYYGQFDLLDARTAITSVGIPISMKFDMIKKDRFRLNSRLGVVNEFPIYENSTTNFTPSNQSQLKHFNFGYMGAVQLNVGAEFRIANNLRIGINPGFKYYFTQQMESENFLINKNNWFGGSFGLTWTL